MRTIGRAAPLLSIVVVVVSCLTNLVFAAGDFEVTPREVALSGPYDRGQLIVTRSGAADATREAVFESSDPKIATVSSTGSIRPHADGQATVRAVVEGEAREVAVTVTGFGVAGGPRFVRDVVPVFNRAGCSSGSCHASQYGKGGFKLSLLGYAPEQDHRPLLRDDAQRRISFVRPSDSLLLQKPLLQVAHGGGRRFFEKSVEHQILLDWIKSTAPGPVKDASTVTDLRLVPSAGVYQIGQSQQLRAVAEYSDGQSRDVTHLVMYDSLSDAVASIDSTGYLTARGRGQAPMMVRFMGQAKVSLVLVPFSDASDLSGFEPRNLVDELVARHWTRLGLTPSTDCTDEEFVRRVYLDTIGTLPSREAIEEFAASPAADKRDQLIDSLLGLTGDPQRDVFVNEWSAYWALKWGDLIRNNRNKLGDGGMWSLYNWMRSSLRENKPVDQFVQELITAQGSVFRSGPANYFKIASKPEDLAEATAQNFLGIRMQCAKCHHHPFEVYSQADYYGLAAFFTRVASKTSTDFGSLGGDTVVMVKRSGSIRHPRTGKTAPPTVLDGEPIDPDEHRDLRRPLATWLTAGENRLFARNVANRFWAYLMGNGLVEPIDDMRATNPATNPELLDALADYLVECDFDLRRFMKVILSSRAYQLSSRPRPENVANERFYTHYNVRRLPAEVLLDAVDQVCGTREKFTGIPAGTRAIELPDPNFASYFLDTMGRPKRVITCECERTSAPNLAQILHMANGDLISRKVSDKNGRIADLAKREMDDGRAVREIYLVSLSRPPTEDEIEKCREIIQAAESRREGLEDILWALCNTREFLFNH